MERVGASFASQRGLRCCTKPQGVFGFCGFLSDFYLQVGGKRSGPDETRTRDFRHARAARALLARTILSKNSAHLRGFWQPWHALFSVLFGSILARLLHLCCTVNAKLAKGEWESLQNSLMPE